MVGDSLRAQQTRTMIRHGFVDAQDFRTTNCQKNILYILFIHVDKQKNMDGQDAQD